MTTTPASPAGVGQLVVDGEYASLVFERSFSQPPEEVWAAITDPRAMVGWYLTEATVDGRPGGSIEFQAGPSRFHVTGKILTWDPPRCFEHEWNVPPNPGLPDGEQARIRWALERDGGGTRLHLTHSHLRRRTATGFAPGLHAFLDRLQATLAGAPLPDWRERYEAVAPEYPASWIPFRRTSGLPGAEGPGTG